MGIFFSNLNNPNKPPYEVLDLPPLFTKSQARSQYLKLIRLNPSLISIYNSAYDIIKREPPNLNLYTKNILMDPFYVIDLFDRISDFSGFKCPEFRSPDFYKKFKNYNCPRILVKKEEERNLFNFKIRKIIKEVYEIYENEGGGGDKGSSEGGVKVGGMVKVMEVGGKVKVNEGDNITTSLILKEKQFKCEYCSKGFRSKNQLINHFKSKKHFEKIKEKEKEPKRFIKEQIEVGEGKVEGVKVGEVGVKEGVYSKEDKEEGNKDNKDIIKDNTPLFISKDPIAFRTCSRCNKRFENRIKMIEHIKKEH